MRKPSPSLPAGLTSQQPLPASRAALHGLTACRLLLYQPLFPVGASQPGRSSLLAGVCRNRLPTPAALPAPAPWVPRRGCVLGTRLCWACRPERGLAGGPLSFHRLPLTGARGARSVLQPAYPPFLPSEPTGGTGFPRLPPSLRSITPPPSNAELWSWDSPQSLKPAWQARPGPTSRFLHHEVQAFPTIPRLKNSLQERDLDRPSGQFQAWLGPGGAQHCPPETGCCSGCIGDGVGCRTRAGRPARLCTAAPWGRSSALERGPGWGITRMGVTGWEPDS